MNDHPTIDSRLQLRAWVKQPRLMKRILLFLGTNLAIVLVLSFTMRLLGVEPYLNENGLNLGSLLIFAA
jgi:hypothetical protein